MRLFGLVNGQIDTVDRAGWITPPFHLNLRLPTEGLLYTADVIQQTITLNVGQPSFDADFDEADLNE